MTAKVAINNEKTKKMPKKVTNYLHITEFLYNFAAELNKIEQKYEQFWTSTHY